MGWRPSVCQEQMPRAGAAHFYGQPHIYSAPAPHLRSTQQTCYMSNLTSTLLHNIRSTLTHLTLLLALLCNVILGLYDPWYNATACYCIFFRSHLYLSILECARGCSATECYRVLWPKKKWSVLEDALQPCFQTGPGHYHVSRGQRVPGLLLYIQWILSTQQ